MAKPARHYTAQTLADDLGVSPAHIYNLCKEGKIPHIRIGKSIRIPKDRFEEFVNNQWEQSLNDQLANSSDMKTDDTISTTPTQPDAAGSFQHALIAQNWQNNG
jgi:excisionase family DNA binding protein